jgi:hypothetical protein
VGAGPDDRAPSEYVVGSGLDPVALARQMLELGATEFSVGPVRVVFAEAVVHEAALRRLPPSEPQDAESVKRARVEDEERKRLEAIELDLWSTS